MKRKWLMVPLVTGMLAVGLTGATAFAHTGGGEAESAKDTVAAKVAEILGIGDSQTVKDALQQATQEVRSDQTEHRLGHMVEGERLTQAEADAYLAWYAARPDVPNLHLDGHRMFGGDGEGARPGRLDRMVEEGKLTQAEADAYAEWLADRPEMPSLRDWMSSWRGEGEDGERRLGRGHGRGPGGHRFGGQGFPGLSQLPNGQGFPGQGEFPRGLADEAPAIEGTSY